MYVSAPLVSLKLLKTKRWYVEHKCMSTISRFLIGQNVKKWLRCDARDCSPRRLVGGDRSCKGYPVYSRLISTILFHLYHERDGDTQEILITLLSRPTMTCMLPYEGAPDLPMCSLYYIICLHTLKPQSDRCLLSLPTCIQEYILKAYGEYRTLNTTVQTLGKVM